MAVPTLAELHEFYGEFVEKHQLQDQFAVFEHEYLASRAWRHFKTTSPAIRSRINQLVEDGKLARIKVSENGFVYTDDEVLDQGLFTLYFQYANLSGYRHTPDDYGFVTAKRTDGHDNVWRSGLRYLYTTAEQHQLMIEHFRKVKAERAAKSKADRTERDARLATLLEASSPGAQQVMDELRERLGGLQSLSDVEGYLRQRDNGPERLCLSIDTRTTESSLALLGIIRRGLAVEEKR